MYPCTEGGIRLCLGGGRLDIQLCAWLSNNLALVGGPRVSEQLELLRFVSVFCAASTGVCETPEAGTDTF